MKYPDTGHLTQRGAGEDGVDGVQVPGLHTVHQSVGTEVLGGQRLVCLDRVRDPIRGHDFTRRQFGRTLVFPAITRTCKKASFELTGEADEVLQ